MSSRLQTCSGFEHVDVNCRCQLGWSFAVKALSLQHFRLLNLREAEWSLPRFHVWNRCGSNLTFGRGSLWGKLPDLHQPQHGSKGIAANANKPTMMCHMLTQLPLLKALSFKPDNEQAPLHSVHRAMPLAQVLSRPCMQSTWLIKLLLVFLRQTRQDWGPPSNGL